MYAGLTLTVPCQTLPYRTLPDPASHDHALPHPSTPHRTSPCHTKPGRTKPDIAQHNRTAPHLARPHHTLPRRTPPQLLFDRLEPGPFGDAESTERASLLGPKIPDANLLSGFGEKLLSQVFRK